MAIINKAFSQIKLVTETVIPESKVYLFGSRARLDNRTLSDYDILIVTKNNYSPVEKAGFKSSIRKLLAGFGIPVDILVNSEEEISIRKNLPGHIIKEVMKERIQL